MCLGQIIFGPLVSEQPCTRASGLLALIKQLCWSCVVYLAVFWVTRLAALL